MSGTWGLVLGAAGFLIAAGNALISRKKFSLDLFEAALAEVRLERDECRRERAEFRMMLVDNGLLSK